MQGAREWVRDEGRGEEWVEVVAESEKATARVREEGEGEAIFSKECVILMRGKVFLARGGSRNVLSMALFFFFFL